MDERRRLLAENLGHFLDRRDEALTRFRREGDVREFERAREAEEHAVAAARAMQQRYRHQ